MTSNPLRRLQPTGEVSAEEVYRCSRRRPDGRPWVMVNMVVSLDGATAVDGLSGELGGDGDQAVFAELRRIGEIVLVGRGTAEAEGYRPRAQPGRWLAVVSNSGRVDAAHPMWSSERTVLVVPDGVAVPDGIRAIRAGTGTVDLTVAVARLGTLPTADPSVPATVPRPAPPVILCEGGPTLNGAMVATGLVDEWCLSLASVLVGGPSDRVATGGPALTPPQDMRIVSVLQSADGVFLRALRPEHC